jgi:hypothetical protein
LKETDNKEIPKTSEIVKLRNQGQSLVVTITKDLAQLIGWKTGDPIYMEITKPADNLNLPFQVTNIIRILNLEEIKKKQ